MNFIDIDWEHLLGRHGWMFVTERLDTNGKYYQYEKPIYAGENKMRVVAMVACDADHYHQMGDVGVLWLEADASTFTCKRSMSWGVLDEMRAAILAAEQDLVDCGIPFRRDYKFHDATIKNVEPVSSAEIRQARNAITRANMALDALIAAWRLERGLS